MIRPSPSSPSSITMGSPSNVPALVVSGNSDSSSAKIKKRNPLLNKFLSKTYHMVDSCDSGVACWSNGGKAFTILDQERFQDEVLPKYFNHSKFTSFIRQLNFYGFVKLRSESDLQIHTQAVRFAHEFFQKGRPDLLHRITRSTAQKPAGDADGNQMEAMQERIDALERKVQHLEEATDQKIRQVTVSLTEGYMARISTLEASYERLLHGITQLLPPMGPSLSSSSLSSANAAVAAAAAAANRNGATWPNPSSSPLLGHLDPSLVSNYVRSKNQQH